MTKCYISYKVNANIPPVPDPAAQVQKLEGFLVAMKFCLQSGVLKELNTFLQGSEGYRISGDISKEQFVEALDTRFPYVTFKVHETIPTTEQLEIAINNIKKMR